MFPVFRVWAVICLLLMAVPAMAQFRATEDPADMPEVVAPEPEYPKYGEDEVLEPLTLELMLESLDLRGRISQLMVATSQGLQAPNIDDVGYMRAYPPGGMVIPQMLKPSAAAVYVAKLRGVEELNRIPLLVGANLYQLAKRDRDAESGFVQLPSLLSMAAAQDKETGEKIGRILAEHMKAMGFDMHLGPSLELAPVLEDSPGSIYTFGSNPNFVAQSGTQLLEIFDEYNVLAIPWGFPGGGLNRVGKDPAVLLTPAQRLMEEDLYPFRHAIATGARVIHVGDTIAPTIDENGFPSCASPHVLNELLRVRMNYEGIVLAGPMDGIGVSTSHLEPEVAAEIALRSGAELLYWQGSPHQVMRVIEKLVKEVEEGRLDEAIINSAVRRVLQLKLDLRLEEQKNPIEKDLIKFEKQKDLIKEVFAVERNAITLVKNKGYVLPIPKKEAGPVGVTGVIHLEELKGQLEEHVKLVFEQRITSARHMGRIPDFEIDRLTRNISGVPTIVVVLTDDMELPGQKRLISAFKEKGARVVAVLLGYPKNLPELDEADAILLAYCDKATYQETLKAVADVLAGKGPLRIDVGSDATFAVGQSITFNAYDVLYTPSGRLPLTLSEKYKAGTFVSSDPTLAVKKLHWDLGNGKTSKEYKFQHSYKTPGVYPVTLTVTDLMGHIRKETFTITVKE